MNTWLGGLVTKLAMFGAFVFWIAYVARGNLTFSVVDE